MGNCFPSAYKWLSHKTGGRHSVPNSSPPYHRNSLRDLEFENLMLSDETIQAAQRWFKKSRKRLGRAESPIREETSRLTHQSGQIMDPAIFLRSGDSNYYSWISTNENDAPEEDDAETPVQGEDQCMVYVQDCGQNAQATSSVGVSTIDSSWLTRFKKLRRSAVATYTRRNRHPYSQLSGTPSSDNSGGGVDLEWEPEAAMLPFLSADLRWEYLNNYATMETCRRPCTANLISGNYTNLTSRRTNIQPKQQKQNKPSQNTGTAPTSCSTPKSGRSSSPALEWDPDDILDPETSELLTEIDRIAQNMDHAAWSA